MLPFKALMTGGTRGLNLSFLGNTTDTNTGNKIVAVTPTAGALLIVFAFFSGTTVSSITDDQGGTYTAIGGGGWYVRTAMTASAVVHTITAAQSAASTGGCIAVINASGMKKTGAAAVLNNATNVTGAGATPSVVMGLASTATPLIGAVTNSSNPCGVTEPTGYTEGLDSGYATPTTGVEIAFVNGGQASGITWGSTSATIAQAAGLVLDPT